MFGLRAPPGRHPDGTSPCLSHTLTARRAFPAREIQSSGLAGSRDRLGQGLRERIRHPASAGSRLDGLQPTPDLRVPWPDLMRTDETWAIGSGVHGGFAIDGSARGARRREREETGLHRAHQAARVLGPQTATEKALGEGPPRAVAT